MEELSILTIKKFKDTIERILHVPGNYRGGILEMAVVADSRLQVEEIQNILPQLLKALKQKGQIFQNVRFNYIFWKNQSIETTVCPMMQAMLESFYQPYEKVHSVERNAPTNDIETQPFSNTIVSVAYSSS